MDSGDGVNGAAICLFVTGGTFDKEYDEINGRLYFEDTHLPEMLRMARCRLDVQIRTLMMVDSLEMTDADRDLIALADELAADDRVGDDTWARLATRWSEAELIELLLVAGMYRLVSGFLNSTGVRLDDGVPGFPG